MSPTRPYCGAGLLPASPGARIANVTATLQQNVTLRRIISRAYGLTDDPVSGPAWLDSECYDIRAKASHNVPDRDLMQMIQPLLKERRHLIAEREKEERPIFALPAQPMPISPPSFPPCAINWP